MSPPRPDQKPPKHIKTSAPNTHQTPRSYSLVWHRAFFVTKVNNRLNRSAFCRGWILKFAPQRKKRLDSRSHGINRTTSNKIKNANESIAFLRYRRCFIAPAEEGRLHFFQRLLSDSLATLTRPTNFCGLCSLTPYRESARDKWWRILSKLVSRSGRRSRYPYRWQNGYVASIRCPDDEFIKTLAERPS